MNNEKQIIPQSSADNLSLAARFDGQYSPKQIDTIFATIASACRTSEDKIMYLMKCRSEGLDPMRGELHAVERNEKQADGSYKKKVTFVVSYHVFVARAQAQGWIIRGMAVCKNDKWDGWDAVNCAPVAHVTAKGDRGPVIGAWAQAVRPADKIAVGSFYDFSELVVKNNYKYNEAPATMAEKSAKARVARSVCPQALANLLAFEEIGEQQTAPAPQPETIRETTAQVISNRPQFDGQKPIATIETPVFVADKDYETMDAHSVPLQSSETVKVRLKETEPLQPRTIDSEPQEPVAEVAEETAPRPPAQIVEIVGHIIQTCDEIATADETGKTTMMQILTTAHKPKDAEAWSKHLIELYNGRMPERLQPVAFYEKALAQVKAMVKK